MLHLLHCLWYTAIYGITAVAFLITGIAAFVAAFPQEGASVTFFLEPRLGLRRAPLISFFFTSLRAS